MAYGGGRRRGGRVERGEGTQPNQGKERVGNRPKGDPQKKYN